eukprot:395233-Pleurochrysis_carterae.AAC.1
MGAHARALTRAEARFLSCQGLGHDFASSWRGTRSLACIQSKVRANQSKAQMPARKVPGHWRRKTCTGRELVR